MPAYHLRKRATKSKKNYRRCVGKSSVHVAAHEFPKNTRSGAVRRKNNAAGRVFDITSGVYSITRVHNITPHTLIACSENAHMGLKNFYFRTNVNTQRENDPKKSLPSVRKPNTPTVTNRLCTKPPFSKKLGAIEVRRSSQAAPTRPTLLDAYPPTPPRSHKPRGPRRSRRQHLGLNPDSASV